MPDAAYREVAPPAALRPWVECLWRRRAPGDAAEDVHRVLPDGCIDLIWSDGAGLLAVGPNTTAFLARMAPGEGAVGVRFRPGGAPALLGVPADALLDVRAPAAEVWGPDAERLEEAVAGAAPAGGARRAAAATGWNGAWRGRPLPTRWWPPRSPGCGGVSRSQPSPAGWGWGSDTCAGASRPRWATAPSGSRGWCGCSGPSRSPARAGTRGWSEVAFEAGYADQSHLVNDCRALAGVPPTLLAA